jgi:glycosyltransferase involved in cell wall biosynthesis
MVTAGRVKLAERAVRCFCAQTWRRKELVVVDDGEADYAPMLRRYYSQVDIRYQRLPPRRVRRLLGDLRNVSLDCALGEYCIQWDDDDWYHPRRIEVQMQALAEGFEASVLRHTLMHIGSPPYASRLFRTALRRGTPGTILHRRSDLRYPNQPKGEDTAYLDRLRRAQRVAVLGAEHSHLFIRCFHGRNTWHLGHFTQRLHRTVENKLQYVWSRVVKRDIFAHAAFHLTPDEAESARLFLEDNRELALAS